MSRSLWTMVVIVLVVSFHALAAASPSCLVTPSKSIGPLRLGMIRDEVIRLWGSADGLEAREAGGHWMEYALLRTALVGLDGDGKVELIAVDDDPCMATTESIAVGNPRSKIHRVYGHPSEMSDAILSAILVKKKARLRIGTGFQDLYFDSYFNRGLTVVTGQTMHLNGYAPNGQPIFVAVDPEPLVRGFIVYAQRLQEPVTAYSPGGAR